MSVYIAAAKQKIREPMKETNILSDGTVSIEPHIYRKVKNNKVNVNIDASNHRMQAMMYFILVFVFN